MAGSTTLTDSHLAEIRCAYGLNFSDLKPLPGGHANSSFLLSADIEKFVLTLFENKAEPAVANLGRLLKYLEAHEFSTVRPVADVGGGMVTRFDDRPAILKRFLTGQVTEFLNERTLEEAGKQLARLHAIPAPDFLPVGHLYATEFFPAVIGSDADPEYESWLKQEIEAAEENLPDFLPAGLTHGDLFFDNLLTEGGSFRAIIDFDSACHDRFVSDLGMAMVGLCSRKEVLELNRAGALVNGYQRVRKLDDSERACLQDLTVFAAAGTSAWRFWKYRIESPSSEKACKHLEMVRLAEQIKAIEGERFRAGIFSRES